MAGRLSGFSEAVIDKACYVLEGIVPSEFESKMPPIGTIEDACRNASRVAQEPAKFWLWECRRCAATYASREASTNGCQKCGGSLVLMSQPEEFDHAAYMRDVRQHPQTYVRVADVFREVIAKRQAEGKRI